MVHLVATPDNLWCACVSALSGLHSSSPDGVEDVGTIEQKILLPMTAHAAYESFMDEKKHQALFPKGGVCTPRACWLD